MNKISKEFKVGVVVIVAIALLFIGVNYLKGINLFEKQNVFFATYDQIDGLNEANPVILKGYKVGLVKEIMLDPEGSGKLIVTILINKKNLNIPEDSKAKIYSSDFFGSKAIELELGTSIVMAEPGSELESGRQEDITTALRKELEPLRARTEDLIGDIDEIIKNMKAVFEADATQGLPMAFESLQRSLLTFEKTSLRLDSTIAENKQRISNIMSNVESITSNFDANGDKITQVMSNVEAITDSIAKINFVQTMAKADSAMTNFAGIMEKINSGEGSMGMLINNDSLHNALVTAAQELDILLNDIETNPDRYIHFSVFGKKDKNKFSKKEVEQMKNALKTTE